MNPRFAWRFWQGVFWTLAAWWSAVVLAQTNERPQLVWTRAGQFTAHAPSAADSSLLCVLAGRVKREWLRRLDLADQWRDPIVLVLAERPAELASAPNLWMEVARTDLHLRFQIHLRVPPPLEEEFVAGAVVRALCAEYANREREFPRQAPVAITEAPLWLVEGLAQSASEAAERLLPVLQRVLAGGKPWGLEELMAVATLPSDPAERLRFRAHAWALVEGLLSLSKGPEKLSQLLRAPQAFWEIYRWQFPDVVAAEKWWSLWLADRTSVMLPGLQSAEETSRQLAQILASKVQLRLPEVVAEAPVAFVDLARYTRKNWLAPLLQDKIARLNVLLGVAHPLYRTAITHYLAALEALAAEQTGRFRYETQRAQRAHRNADERSRQIREYLDRVEQQRGSSEPGGIRQQLKLLETVRELDVLRRDPISVYLDQFDR